MIVAKSRRYRYARAAVVGYGILNAVLYASLLPLWEGFDEPFHYSYVQHVAEFHSLPQLGKAHLSREVWDSLHLAPASDAVRVNLPWVTTFGEYFRSPPESRARIRAQVDALHGGSGWSAAPNYEAQHPPLAYAILAVPERSLALVSLPLRIWLLRLICGVFAVLLTAASTFSLAKRLNISPGAQRQLVFVVLSSQMFYAATAHVANDWLAVPLMLLIVDRCVALQSMVLQTTPAWREMAFVMAALVCGLLTKAYVLALVPLVAVMFVRIAVLGRIPRSAIAAICTAGAAICLPWYVRNFILYKSLTGMQEEAGGLNAAGLLTTVRSLPWGNALKRSVFEGLWSGNNSFMAFSAGTLWLWIAGAGLLGVLYLTGVLRNGGPIPVAERIVWASIALYGGALIYYIALSYQVSAGVVVNSCPWYMPPMTIMVLTLLFTGVHGRLIAGRIASRWLVWLSAYIILATYWAKLVPLYGGFLKDRTTLAELYRWYTGNATGIVFNLSTTALVDVRLIGVLLAVLTIAVPCLAAMLTAESACSNSA